MAKFNVTVSFTDSAFYGVKVFQVTAATKEQAAAKATAAAEKRFGAVSWAKARQAR